jgi:P27 family predicted phage terminase small subunit
LGRRGARPEPTASKLARGVRKDRLNSSEPVPSVRPSFGEPPERLGPEAAEVWGSLAPDLAAAGVLTDWDAPMFETFCELEVEKRKAHGLFSKSHLMKGRRDPFVTNPEWRIYRDTVRLQLEIAREFGLTPSARSAISLPGRRQMPDLDDRSTPEL